MEVTSSPTPNLGHLSRNKASWVDSFTRKRPELGSARPWLRSTREYELPAGVPLFHGGNLPGLERERNDRIRKFFKSELVLTPWLELRSVRQRQAFAGLEC